MPDDRSRPRRSSSTSSGRSSGSKGGSSARSTRKPSRSKGGSSGRSSGKGSKGTSGKGSRGGSGKGSKGTSGKGSKSRRTSSDRDTRRTNKGSSDNRSSSGDTAGSGRRGDRERPPTGRARQWGSLAQRGARRASEPDEGPPRAPAEALSPDEQARRAERARRRELRELDQDRLRGEARDAVDRAETRTGSGRRSTTRPMKRSALPKVPLSLDEPEVAITRLVGTERAPEYVRALRLASQDFARERYHDARRHLAPALRAVPDVPEVAELQGLIQYRLGNWKAATEQLERFRSLTGTAEQHPVLADSYRALGRYPDVDALWDELRSASPSAELVTEGRIVAAGALADQGQLTAAIALLEKGWTRPKKPRTHHLRRAYALADLYERHGRAPRARELFRWIQSRDAQFADVGRRVAAL